MCGRYYVDREMTEEVFRDLEKSSPSHLHSIKKERVAAVEDTLTEAVRQGDVRPTDRALVVATEKESSRDRIYLTQQVWGYPNTYGKGVIINARAETVQEKKMFHKGFCSHRVLIPARHFYEWSSRKELYTFERKDTRVLYLAGIADTFQKEPCFVILTTAANASVSAVHDRMPLILEKNQLQDWLWDETAAKALLSQKPVQLNSYTEYEQMSFF